MIDDAKMSEPGDELVLYGEGEFSEQVYNVAKSKISQYKLHAPNILVIESSSNCIDDVIIPTAVDKVIAIVEQFELLLPKLWGRVTFVSIVTTRGRRFYPELQDSSHC